MTTLKKIKDELEAVSTVSAIVDVYQKTAYSKMINIRKDVLKTRQFLTQLADVYHTIRSSHEFFAKESGKKRGKTEEVSPVETKKGQVLVFLSANHFFYGTLILDVWSEAYEFWKSNKPDLVVVGKTGRYLAKNYGLGDKIFYFDLDDAKPEKSKIAEIINFIKKYKKVIVSHGRFETVMVQNPVMSDILGEVPTEREGKSEIKKYLFEPTPEAVMDFFETEIMASLFNQTILEHALARYATRMMSMYHASENAKKMKKEIEKSKRKLEWQELDKKQVEIFSAFQLWEKKN